MENFQESQTTKNTMLRQYPFFLQSPLGWVRLELWQLWFPKWTNIALLVLSACLMVFITLGVYNRFLHPLRNIPGPFWSSVTDLYKLFVLSIHDVSKFSLKLHDEYGERRTGFHGAYPSAKELYAGPLVRVAPNLLSFSDPLDIPLVYHRKSDKDSFWTHGALGEDPPLLQTLEHREHSRKRKMMAPVVRTFPSDGWSDILQLTQVALDEKSTPT